MDHLLPSTFGRSDVTNRTIVLVSLILIIAIGTNWFLDVADEPPAPDPTARNEPDLYMVDARITQFSTTGDPQHAINAERMTHFPLTDVTTLKVPNIVLYSEEAPSPWHIIATNGRLLPKSSLSDETVELWDQVLASRENEDGDFVNIQTESMTVYPERDFAETREPVTIDNQTSRTSAGGGMKANLGNGVFEFFAGKQGRVVTIIASRGAGV